jgi:hypothetical protein
VVTGQSNKSESSIRDPAVPWILVSGGVLTDFGLIFGSGFNYGNDINDSGLIAGSADLAGDVGAHAILWNQVSVQDLTPDGDIVAWGIGINIQGEVVGSYASFDPIQPMGRVSTLCFVPAMRWFWQSGQMIFLNSVVSPSWNLWLGLAINDKSEILARGQFNGGSLETVLLKPIKHPTSSGSQSTRVVGISKSKRGLLSTGLHQIRRDHSGTIIQVR